LCLALGVQHPSRLDLTNGEIAEWFAYFTEHPFGEDMTHVMLARIMSMVSGKQPASHMIRFIDGEMADPDMAAAEAFLQEEIRLGNC
jgi:hypothetical protein